MNYIEQAKQYSGTELENIFFRPILTGQSAQDIGVRILYNMPQPTHIQLWDGNKNLLQKYTAAGWTGGKGSSKTEKTIQLSRVKAEIGFSAADYFSMVYEKVAALVGNNMDDLSGTELEKAETELFRQTLAENIRTTMWIGDSTLDSGYNTFDGFLKTLMTAFDSERFYNEYYQETSFDTPDYITTIFDHLWEKANPRLHDCKPQGQLVYFVTSDLYYRYEKYLDSKGVDSAYLDAVNGRQQLAYHGIPVVDVRLSSYLGATSYHKSFCILTDRRNLVLAVNTADMPGNEVRMWYNPDEMENRQRAVFMAGCEMIDPLLVSYGYLLE